MGYDRDSSVAGHAYGDDPTHRASGKARESAKRLGDVSRTHSPGPFSCLAAKALNLPSLPLAEVMKKGARQAPNQSQNAFHVFATTSTPPRAASTAAGLHRE